MNRRAERAAIAAFSIAIVGGLVSAAGYWTSHTERVLGLGLATALFATGFGLVAWSKSIGIDEDVVEQREVHPQDAPDAPAWRDDLGTGARVLGRRRAIAMLFAGSLGAVVVAFVGPIGSLGPKPRGERGRTSWKPGTRLVTADGAPVAASQSRLDQLVTVFPDGAIGRDDSQVVLLRVRPESLSRRTVDGGAVDGWVAYSKICTHAGCSVGLFGVDTRPPDEVRELVCPCHQSVFDPLDGARPVGGPAPRSLPQLPLDVDAAGYLVARDDFDRVVGPITWTEG